MKLKEYLHINKIRIVDFARISKTSPQTIIGIMAGSDPRGSIIKKIINSTGGAVKFDDFYSDDSINECGNQNQKEQTIEQNNELQS